MKLTTEQVVNIFGTLRNTKNSSLDNAVRMTLIDIRAALRPIATAYEAFNEDAEETLKFENFDQLNIKAQANALVGEEILAWNLGFLEYRKALAETRKSRLVEEHDLEIPTISLADYIKLEKANDWPMGVEDILAPIIKKK